MGFFSKLFSFTQELAIDLGTANTIIIADDEIAVNEPSVVALDTHAERMIAVGDDAKLMYEKTNSKIRVIRPLRDGVIADFNACEQMMRGLIKKVHSGKRLFSPSLRMVIGVPSGSTEVELRAVRDSAEHAGGRDVFLLYEPMAAAIGIGIDVNAPEGNMIVDIGGGTTEIAVISLGGIVSNNSIKMAGDDFTSDIREYMSRQHNVLVSERMAERIKKHIHECRHYAEEGQMLPLPATAGNLFLPMTTDQPALQPESCDILSGVSLVFPDGTQVNIRRGSAQAVMSFLKLYQREDLPCLD